MHWILLSSTSRQPQLAFSPAASALVVVVVMVMVVVWCGGLQVVSARVREEVRGEGMPLAIWQSCAKYIETRRKVKIVLAMLGIGVPSALAFTHTNTHG